VVCKVPVSAVSGLKIKTNQFSEGGYVFLIRFGRQRKSCVKGIIISFVDVMSVKFKSNNTEIIQ